MPEEEAFFFLIKIMKDLSLKDLYIDGLTPLIVKSNQLIKVIKNRLI